MKNWLSIFTGNSSSSKSKFLSNPGDKIEARITKDNRKVLKISKNKGKSKYSATQYSNGTIVETKTTKK